MLTQVCWCWSDWLLYAPRHTSCLLSLPFRYAVMDSLAWVPACADNVHFLKPLQSKNIPVYVLSLTHTFFCQATHASQKLPVILSPSGPTWSILMPYFCFLFPLSLLLRVVPLRTAGLYCGWYHIETTSIKIAVDVLSQPALGLHLLRTLKFELQSEIHNWTINMLIEKNQYY